MGVFELIIEAKAAVLTAPSDFMAGQAAQDSLAPHAPDGQAPAAPFASHFVHRLLHPAIRPAQHAAMAKLIIFFMFQSPRCRGQEVSKRHCRTASVVVTVAPDKPPGASLCLRCE
jgi:hypothetical protein